MRFLSSRAGTPLLVGPESTQADVGADPIASPSDSEAQSADTPPPESTPTESTPSKVETQPDHTDSAAADKPSDTAKTANGESSTTVEATSTSDVPSSLSVTTSSAISSNAQQPTIGSGPPKIQLTSLAYLVPIFLLVVITVGVIIYRKCRRRKRASDHVPADELNESSHIPVAHEGWKEVAASEDEAEKDEVWSPRSDRDEQPDEADEAWRDVRLHESKSRPGLMDVTYGGGRGWLNSAKWKSARALDETFNESSSKVGSISAGATKTMRLVLPRSVPTYQSLLPPAFTSRRARAGDEEDDTAQVEKKIDSKRSWRDIAFRLTPSRKQLERNNSPNKRRSMHPPAALPDAPEWMVPRTASPDRQVLSPPLQPHLFFQPAPLTNMTTLRLPFVANTESDGTYTDTDTQIGSSVVSNRVRPAAAATTPRKHRHHESGATPTKATSPKRAAGSSDHWNDTTPIQRWRVGLPTLPEPPTRTRSGDASGYMVNGATGAVTSGSPKKSRKERKEQKARERVESILQASWSDRALSSPGASTTDLSSPTTAHRPRIAGQSRDRAGGDTGYGGIDARLAELRGQGA